MNAIMLIGSRNPQGQTARAAEAMISGMQAANAQCESFFLPGLKIERCRARYARNSGTMRRKRMGRVQERRQMHH